jgi:hypothetical protein
MPRSAYWNHNLHYQPVILNAVPPGCQTALDVGCGDGLLAARLAAAPATPVNLWYRAIYGWGESGAPIMFPHHSWREVRAAASQTLPGVRYRRHLLWRYSLLWRKPFRASG